MRRLVAWAPREPLFGSAGASLVAERTDDKLMAILLDSAALYSSQQTPILSTRRPKATTSPHVLTQWKRSHRRSCVSQSLGSNSGTHFAMRLLIGTGPTNENKT